MRRTGLSASPAPSGASACGQVRDAQQQVAQLGGRPPSASAASAARCSPSARLSAWSASASSASPSRRSGADLLRERLDLGPQLVALGRPAARWRLVELDDPVELGGVDAPAGQRRPSPRRARCGSGGRRAWRGDGSSAAAGRSASAAAAGRRAGSVRGPARRQRSVVTADARHRGRRPHRPLRRPRRGRRLSFAGRAGRGRWPCSGPTAPARPPRSRRSRATAGPTAGRCGCSASTRSPTTAALDPPDRRDAPGRRRLPRHPPARGRCGCSPRFYADPADPAELLDRVGLDRAPAHHVAPAVGRRAAAAVAGPGPGRPARGGLPRRAHRRRRLQRPPADPPASSRELRPRRRRACCSPPTTSTRPRRLADRVVIIDHGRLLAERHARPS